MKCKYCGENLTSQEKHLKHLREKHIEIYAKDNDLLICPVCNEYTATDLTQHVNKTHKMPTQDFQNKYQMKLIHFSVASKRANAKYDNEKKTSGIHCKLCNQTFLSPILYNRHLYNYDVEHTLTVHTDVNRDEWVECTICGFRSRNLVPHLMQAHNLTPDEYDGVKHMTKALKTNNEYLDQLKKYVIDGVFNIDLYSGDINKLIKYCNNDLKVIKGFYKCDQCHCSFKNVEVLNKHVKTHLEIKKEIFVIKNHHCPICNINFETNELFVRHCQKRMDIDHSKLIYTDDNKNNWVECQLCGYRAIRIDHHLMLFHNFDIQEYKEKYGDILSQNAIVKVRENGALASLSVNERIYKHKCKVDGCENIISGKELICTKCKMKGAIEIQEKKFIDKIEGLHFVRCKCNLEDGSVCNWPDIRLTGHIKIHGYTSPLYKKHFPNAQIYCNELKNKTAFRGSHSDETKEKMSQSRMGLIPWNTGLTKYDHEGLKSISEKNSIRLSKLVNNPWSINPLIGYKNKRTNSDPWSKGLTKEQSESLENSSETNTSLFHHKSYYGTNNIYDKNKIVKSYRESQMNLVRLIDGCCIDCGGKDNLHVHHIITESLNDFYDLTSHDFERLATLCGSCHSLKGQKLDKALIAVSNNIDELKKRFYSEYLLYLKWMNFAKNRDIPYVYIRKVDIQKMSEQERLDLVENIFCKIRKVGILSYGYTQQELLNDFKNIELSKVNFKDNVLSNYNTSGFKIKEHFIKQQYYNFHELFENDDVLKKVIENRMGFNENLGGYPEFFNINLRSIVTGFEILYPKYRFSKYQSAVAKWIIENYCNGDVIYDYSAGWGARLLACASLRKQYICVDSNEILINELKQMTDWLRGNIKPLKKISINHGDSKTFLPDQKIDMAYSCPPYFNQEKYLGSSYNSYHDWINDFIDPVLKNCYKVLKKDGIFVCHISTRYVDDLVERIKINGVSNHKSPTSNRIESINEKIIIAYKR